MLFKPGDITNNSKTTKLNTSAGKRNNFIALLHWSAQYVHPKFLLSQ